MRRTIATEDVEIEIQRLPSLGPDAMRAQWRALTGKSPGPGLKGELLQRALAHAIQESAFGGLSQSAAKRLAVLAREYRRAGADGGSSKVLPQRRIKSGSRLIREWKGVIHEVTVLPDGYLWNGGTHKALSTIARNITGTHWNGWTFFGLGGSSPTTGRNKKLIPCGDDVHRAATASVTGERADA